MSILTCTNVHPSNEVITIDKTMYSNTTNPTLEEYRKMHPELNGLPDDDVAFYINPPKFSFKFNCSGGTGCMRFMLIEYTNCKTGKMVTYHAPRWSKYTPNSEHNNGDTITYTAGAFNSYAENGQEWQYQRILYQSDKSLLSSSDTEALYDMKFCQGKIALENGKLKLSTGISNLRDALYIYEPKNNDGTIDKSRVFMTYYGKSKTYSDGTTVTIDDSTISSCYLVGGCVIEMNGERHLIQQYDEKTGILTIKGNFITEVKTGDKFVIYTNYFIDKPHYFTTKSKPTIEMNVSTLKSNKNNYNKDGLNVYSVEFSTSNAQNNNYMITTITYNDELSEELINTIINGSSFSCGAIYCKTSFKQANKNQNDYSNLKYYNYSLYTINKDGSQGSLVQTSGDIYDDSLQSSFYVPMVNQTYRVVLNVVTQENAVYTESQDINFKSDTKNDTNLVAPIVENSFRTTLSSTKSHIVINWDWNKDVYGRYEIYRQEKIGSRWSEWTMITATSDFSKSAGQYATVIDYTVGSNVEYRYLIQFIEIDEEYTVSTTGSKIIAKKKVTYYAPYITDVVQHQWTETLITSLVPKSSSLAWKKYNYTPVETWKFVCPSDSNDILQNLGVNVFDVTNGMPLTTRINKEYESSSFSLDLFQLNCPDGSIRDDISLVKKWVKFINADNDFLLKTPKGDVWIIEISGSPSRSYEYGGETVLTKVNYDWVQVAKTEDVNIS